MSLLLITYCAIAPEVSLQISLLGNVVIFHGFSVKISWYFPPTFCLTVQEVCSREPAIS